MDEAARLSALIGDVYDAALDSALWVDVLAKAADFVGGQAAGLLSKDSVSKIGNAHYHSGVDPRFMQLYLEKYWRFDPLATLFFFDVEQVTSTTDFMSYDEFCEGRFFREWAQPQGWVDSANAVLEKSLTSCAYLSVIRDATSGLVDDEMRRRMRLVIPHVRRAVLIGKAIDLKTAAAATFADTLDGLSAGMFLVDASGRIVHANASGHALLADGSLLHAVGGKLVANDANAEQALYEVFISAGNGDAAVGVKCIAVPLTSHDSEPHVAHVLPLTSGARRRAGTNYAAVAAVFVRKAALETASPPEAIAKVYKLTPTELRVLLAIVEIGGVPEVAEALGVSAETVKTHLGRLFEKTDTNRQADLVKLVAGFSNPLLP